MREIEGFIVICKRTFEEIGQALFCKIGANRSIRNPIEIAFRAPANAIVVLAGYSWERWLSSWSVFHLSNLVGRMAGGLIAYFIATFVFYWWHRWRHEVGFLWRGFHQIHHSPQRIEVITSFYKHPVEMVVNSVIGSLFRMLGFKDVHQDRVTLSVVGD